MSERKRPNPVRINHETAMNYNLLARAAEAEGAVNKAEELRVKAFEYEVLATEHLIDKKNVEPTRSLLFLSAATMAINLDYYEEAVELCYTGLGGEKIKPGVVRDLKACLRNAEHYRHIEIMRDKLKAYADRPVYAAKDILYYVLKKYTPKLEGLAITQIKAQKLLYFIQGRTLAYTDRPAFDDPIYAIQHGPVVVSLKDVIGHHKAEPIDPPEDFDESQIDEGMRLIIDDVFEWYGDKDEWYLVDLTHKQAPWQSAYTEGKKPANRISTDAIKAYFKKPEVY